MALPEPINTVYHLGAELQAGGDPPASHGGGETERSGQRSERAGGETERQVVYSPWDWGESGWDLKLGKENILLGGVSLKGINEVSSFSLFLVLFLSIPGTIVQHLRCGKV